MRAAPDRRPARSGARTPHSPPSGSPNAAVVGIWQGEECEDARHIGGGSGNEGLRSSAANRVASEEDGVLLDPPPSGPALRDDQSPDDAPNVPRPIGSQPRRKANLHVEATERLLEIPQSRLHLGNLEHTGRPVEREQVDPSSFAIHTEAGFRPDLPPVRLVELGPRPDQCRMISIQQPIKISRPAPPDPDRELGSEGREDLAGRPEGVPSRSPQFDVRDQGATHPASAGEVHLAPTTAVAEGPDRATERCVIHRRMIARRRVSAAYWRIPMRAALCDSIQRLPPWDSSGADDGRT